MAVNILSLVFVQTKLTSPERTSSPLGLCAVERCVVGDALGLFNCELLSMKIYRILRFGIAVVAVATVHTVGGWLRVCRVERYEKMR